jgi:dTDP-4-dehydrorhamnose reductase
MDRRFSITPELWGGIECSFNRLRSRYFDQLDFSRHYSRIETDVQRFAGLGITTIRYPLIWERMQPDLSQPIKWDEADIAMRALQAAGITPIAGFVHHGSGPKYADVTSPAFAEGLQNFAAAVAEKYPSLRYFTPVNEPLTTARFCGLYGLWYPHKRNDTSFVRIFLNEMKGVVLAMQAIRKVNPEAKLVQTEDLTKVYSTPLLRYQATFENHRRWLTFDLLTGRLLPKHPLWKYFLKHAESETDLRFFTDNPCPPDLLGLDYYPTSERYLDENISRYPTEKIGGNSRHKYADVEAVRVKLDQPSGVGVLMREMWDRYKLPMSIAECHIKCDCDNQVRWFMDVRNACIELMREGVDIRAITTWALLGSFGWDRLLTGPFNNYEPGAFDVSSGEPVRTAIGDYVAALSRNPDFVHPASNGQGWWREDSRFHFGHSEELVESEILRQTGTE